MASQYIEVREGVNDYSRKSQGECIFTIKNKPSNFKVREFACNDGSDLIKIDGELVVKLQMFRIKFGPTTINSGYRTPTYNAKVGGVKNSQHVQGKASDTVCKSVTPLEVALYAEAIGMGGIGLYSTFTHIDTRENKSRWDSTSGREVGVSTFFKTISVGSKGSYVKIAQKYLGVAADGDFGSKTEEATKSFQKKNGLAVDGVIGPQTWVKLLTQ